MKFRFRHRWLLAPALLAGAVAASCGGEPEIIRETVIVTQPAQQQTVVVTQPPSVQTVVVTQAPTERTVVVVATATPVPTSTSIPIEPLEPAPEPQNDFGIISMAVVGPINAGTGLGSAQAPVESMQYWGVGEGLFSMSTEGVMVNKLAESFEIADDLSSATVTLKSGVQFHRDFGEFTADDVVFTLNDGNAATNPTSIHGQAGDFAALFGEVEKIDERTVRIPFISFDLRWNAHFLNEQAQGTAYFSSKAYKDMGEQWMRENIVSTGPFQVKEWIQGDHVYIEKVPYDHWYKNPEVDEVRFFEVPESATRISMLRTGQMDIAGSIPLKDIRDLVESGFKAEQITRRGVKHSLIFDGNYWETEHARTGEPLNLGAVCNNDLAWVGCANQEGDMDEAKQVRQALARAIDRELIIETILDGFGQPGATEYVDTTASYFKPEWSIPYDPEDAKERMAGTSWPEGNFPIGIWTGGELGGGTGTNGEINDAIAGFWKELWPNMDVQVFKSAYSIIRPGLVARSNTIPYAGDCDEGATTIPFDWPHGLTETSMTRGGFGCGIEIPKIAETYLAVASETDLQERNRLNTELVDYLMDEMVIAGVVQVPELTVYNPNAIESWEGTPSIFAVQNEFENIVPAAR